MQPLLHKSIAIIAPVLRSVFLWGWRSGFHSSFELHVYETQVVRLKANWFQFVVAFHPTGRQSEKLAWIVLDSWTHKYISLYRYRQGTKPRHIVASWSIHLGRELVYTNSKN